jgi:hypothetical protein
MSRASGLGRFNFLANPSGVLVPSWVLPNATLDIDLGGNRAWAASVGEVSLDTMLNCSRASGGMAMASNGTWSSFANNVLRRTDQGALIEQGRTNTLLQSQDLTNAAWVPANTVVTGGQAAPDGTTNAALIVDNAVSGAHTLSNSSVTFTASQVYLFQVRAHASSGQFVQLTFQSTRFSGVGYANFDLVNGTRSDFGGTLIASAIRSEGNGWYLLLISATCSSTGTGSASIQLIPNGTAARSASYVGTGTGVIVWNPNIFSTLVYPTSPVYTQGSSVGHSTDNVTPTALAQALMDGAKSCYAETSQLQGGASTPRLLDFAGVAQIQMAAGSTGTTVATVGGSTATATIGGGGKTFDALKSAYSFDGTTNKAISNNGTLASAAGSWGVVSELPTIGNLAALNASINGYLKRLTFSNLPDNFNGLTV